MRHPIVVYCLLPLLLFVSGLSTARAANAQVRLTGSQMRARSNVAMHAWCQDEQVFVKRNGVRIPVFVCTGSRTIVCHHGEHITEGYCRGEAHWLYVQSQQTTTCHRRVHIYLVRDARKGHSHDWLIQTDYRPYDPKKDCTHEVKG